MNKLLFILFTIIFFFLGRGFAEAYIVETYIGSPVGTGIPECPTLSTDPTGCLKRDFNVEVKGEGFSPTNESKRVIYRMLWETSRSEAYRENLMKGGTLIVYIKLCTARECISRVSGDITLTLRSSSLTYSSRLKRLFTHETGHVLRRRAPQAYRQFDINEAVERDGSACYERNFVKSYSLRNYIASCNGSRDRWSVTPKSESFAEAIGNYQFSGGAGNGYLCSKRITNFKTDCSYTYEYVKNNIFGGYEFY